MMIFILLAAVTVYIAYILTACTLSRGKVINKIEGMAQRLTKMTHRSAGKARGSLSHMNVRDRIQMKYIDRSGIKRHLPFFNPWILTLLCAVIFILVFKPVYISVRFIPSAVLISLLFSMMPFFILDLMSRYNSARIRRSLAEFISVLNRWCAVKEDIFYAFEKSMESGLKEPLATFVRDMVIQVKTGISPPDALDMLRLKVGSVQFADFIANIRHSVKNRGDIRRLLTNMEDQFYRMEEEYNRRRISTLRDRITIYILMFAVLFICYGFLKINPDVEAFYLETFKGRLLITLFLMLYGLGFYISLGIWKYEH